MLRSWMVITLVLGMAAAAHAQVDVERFERQLDEIFRDTRLRVDADVDTMHRTLFEYGGYVSFNVFAIDDASSDTRNLRQTDLNLYARANVDGVHQFFVRGRTSYRDFDSGDDFIGNGDDWIRPRLDRAVYRFDLQRYMAAYHGEATDYNIVLQGGRNLVHWGNGLVLSEELDGGTITFSHGPAALEVLGGHTRKSNADIDPFRPQFDKDTRRIFYGGMLRYDVAPKHQVYAYGLVQEDHNRDRTRTAGVPVATRFHYDSHYLGLGARGSLGDHWLYGGEFAYQGGESLSSSFVGHPADGPVTPVTQRNDDIEAFAFDLRVDYLLLDQHQTRLLAEATLATGDADRILFTNSAVGGNSPGSEDIAFNAFGAINTGLAFSPRVSNLMMLRGGASTFPIPSSELFRRLQIGTDMFVFFKFDENAPINEDTEDRRYLGFEVDLFANWQITSDVGLAVRYGVFVPGGAIGGRLIDEGNNARHFLYTGLTFGF